MLGHRLGWVILEVYSNLDDSVIILYIPCLSKVLYLNRLHMGKEKRIACVISSAPELKPQNH